MPEISELKLHFEKFHDNSRRLSYAIYGSVYPPGAMGLINPVICLN